MAVKLCIEDDEEVEDEEDQDKVDGGNKEAFEDEEEDVEDSKPGLDGRLDPKLLLLVDLRAP